MKSFNHCRFVRAGGKVTKMIMWQGEVENVAVKTDKPLPAEHVAVALDTATFDQYVGDYELGPGFVLTISREGDKFIGQATGQPKIEIFPSTPTEFFIKVVDAQLSIQKDASGKVIGLVLHQGGQNIPAKKIK